MLFIWAGSLSGGAYRCGDYWLANLFPTLILLVESQNFYVCQFLLSNCPFFFSFLIIFYCVGTGVPVPVKLTCHFRSRHPFPHSLFLQKSVRSCSAQACGFDGNEGLPAYLSALNGRLLACSDVQAMLLAIT